MNNRVTDNGDGTVTIAVHKSNGCLIDACDLVLVSGYHWYNDHGYAYSPLYSQTDGVTKGGRRKMKAKIVRMHRLIAGTPDGMDTDHINGNRMDNRRSNLRIVTRAQNLWNTKGPRDSIAKGVVAHTLKSGAARYRVYIRFNGNHLYLGSFADYEDAVRCRKEAEQKYHGEFARKACHV